ncbi:MAG: EVE domain-containing protein [Planctomycetota bacterium]|jgi:predicted RNA-binding protein with PUA-like domain
MPAHWLVKQEPAAYPFAQLVADRTTAWDGVRNHQARNHLQAMKRGDLVLYYHSQTDRAIVGVAKVAKTAYPDPTTDDERWVVVDLRAVEPLAEPVTLAQVKADATLKDMALVRQSRLSVMPVTAAQFRRVLQLGRTRL